MGTHYAIYAEVRVGNKWYNLNPLFQSADRKIDVCPVISGRNWLRETYEELEEDRYAYGRPEDMSQEVRTVFFHEDDEPYDPYLHINIYKDFYNRSIFLVNYGKEDRKPLHGKRKNIKKSENALSQADFSKNPVISFSVLRAKKDSHPLGWLSFFIPELVMELLSSGL